MNIEMPKVINLTANINIVGNSFKGQVTELLKRFDFESTNDKTKAKHYPVAMECKANDQEVVIALELMSNALYRTLHKELQGAYLNNGRLDVQALEVGVRNESVAVKIGKLYMCPPNRFTHINTTVPEVMLFAFAYPIYEIEAEINFGIEIY